MPDKISKTSGCLSQLVNQCIYFASIYFQIACVTILFNVQAGYNPLMLAVANDIEIKDYQDMLCHLIDKTGVNLTAEKVTL